MRVPLLLAVVAASAATLFLGACVGDDPVAPVSPGAPDDAAAKADSSPPSADTGAPDAGKEAGEKRFCETQAPVTGVADFFCADFDGPKLDEGFTNAIIPDGGALIRTTDIFFSPPASLATSGGARLLWAKSGAMAFAELAVQVRVNAGTLGGVVPPSAASATLVELSSIDTTVSIRYTRGGTVEGTSNYTGYYMETSYCPAACALAQKKIATPLPLDVWTNVEVVWTSSGLVKVSFNGVSVLATMGFASTSTKVSATLGIVSFGSVGMGRHAFDDFIVSVKRL